MKTEFRSVSATARACLPLGIKDARITAEGHLELVLSDESIIDAGALPAQTASLPSTVLEWHSGTDPTSGTVHPTEAEKAANKEKLLAALSAGDGQERVFLSAEGLLIPASLKVGDHGFSFLSATSSGIRRYQLGVYSGGSYYQFSENCVLDEIDESSPLPVSSEAVSDYVAAAVSGTLSVSEEAS